jgi:glucose 1-dehydrogenase
VPAATPINASTIADPAKLKDLNDAIPLGRLAEPNEIADLVVFLASGCSAALAWTLGGCRW